MKRTINVLYIRAGESPRAVTIPNNLKFMQKLVGGNIERYALPTDDDAVIICNDEGTVSYTHLFTPMTREQKSVKPTKLLRGR